MTKLSYTTLFSYGSLGLPLAMLGLPLYIYLPTYYADTLGLGMGIVGSILMIARIIDMIADPLIGFANDRFIRTLGGPKGAILIGSLILLISFYALIHPLRGFETVWLFTFSVLAYLGWSAIHIPYLAHNADISPLYHEKTRLSGARELFSILGGIITVLLPYLLDVSDNPAQTLPLLYLAFVSTLLITLPLSLSTFHSTALTKDYVTPLKTLWISIHKSLVGAFFINSLANAIPATLFLLYIDGCLNEKDSTGLLLLLYFVSGIVALPVWVYVSHHIGKRLAWISSMLLASAAFSFVPFLGEGDLTLFTLICIISGFSLGADMALPASMQADIVERNDGMAGVLFGIWAMITKLSLALAVGIGFMLLGSAGYNVHAPSANDQLILSLLYGALPVVLKIIAIGMIIRYREDELTKKGYE